MQSRSYHTRSRWTAPITFACFGLSAPACDTRSHPAVVHPPPAASKATAVSRPTSSEHEARWREMRLQMVAEQIEARGVRDARVLAAMREVPRHQFVAPAYRSEAYADHPLPIEAAQTISQPYIVGLMSELAEVATGDKVLEVGTGSGYQAAVLAQLGARTYSIEIVEELAKTAQQRLDRLGYRVQVRHGDGYAGWSEQAPFDAILITAAPPKVPEPLKQQLRIGGKLVVPVGDRLQELIVITRTEHGWSSRSVLAVRFVPMTGKAQEATRAN